MDFKLKYKISPRYLTKPSQRRSGYLISPAVKFLVAHDTGNPGSSASGNVRYYQRSRNEMSASAHIFVDDREIIECIPAIESSPPEKAWHVLRYLPKDDQLFGYDANDAAIGVEYCYGGRIDDNEAYCKYVWVIAYLCYKFDLNPKKHVVGHFFLDPHRKTDPLTGLAYNRRSYEQLLRDIVAEYFLCTGQKEEIFSNTEQLENTSGEVVTTVRLNIRKGAPNTMAPIYQTVSRGTKIKYKDLIENGEPVNGNPVWYRDLTDNYFWSGGVIH